MVSLLRGIKTVERRIKRLQRELKGQAEIRPASVRWAWVEYQLAPKADPNRVLPSIAPSKQVAASRIIAGNLKGFVQKLTVRGWLLARIGL